MLKARIKGTNDFQEVLGIILDKSGKVFEKPCDIEFEEPDYWEKLRHQAAIAAMQSAIIELPNGGENIVVEAVRIADSLIKELKK